MTISSTQTTLDRAPQQTVFDTYRAEVRRLVAAGGMRSSAIVFAVLAFAGGALALLILTTLPYPLTEQSMTVPVELATTISVFGMSLATVITVCRDNTGFLSFSLLYTPKRARLLVARMLAYATASVAVTMSALLAVVIVAAVVTQVFPLGLIGAGFLFGALAAALFTVACVGLATIVERQSGALLTFIGVVFILPLVLGMFGGLVPAWAQPAAISIAEVMPAILLFKALSLSTIALLGVGSNILAQLGLAIWAAVAGSGALFAFHHRDR